MPSSASRTTASGELMSFFIVCWVLMRSPRVEEVPRERSEHAADERRHDGDPRIAPIRRALARDRQDRVCDARGEVAGRVDRIAGRTAEREADREDQQADDE